MRPNSDFLSMGLQDGALIFRYLFKKISYVSLSRPFLVEQVHVLLVAWLLFPVILMKQVLEKKGHI